MWRSIDRLKDDTFSFLLVGKFSLNYFDHQKFYSTKVQKENQNRRPLKPQTKI